MQRLRVQEFQHRLQAPALHAARRHEGHVGGDHCRPAAGLAQPVSALYAPVGGGGSAGAAPGLRHPERAGAIRVYGVVDRDAHQGLSTPHRARLREQTPTNHQTGRRLHFGRTWRWSRHLSAEQQRHQLRQHRHLHLGRTGHRVGQLARHVVRRRQHLSEREPPGQHRRWRHRAQRHDRAGQCRAELRRRRHAGRFHRGQRDGAPRHGHGEQRQRDHDHELDLTPSEPGLSS
jgi:hypothetical protein